MLNISDLDLFLKVTEANIENTFVGHNLANI